MHAKDFCYNNTFIDVRGLRYCSPSGEGGGNVTKCISLLLYFAHVGNYVILHNNLKVGYSNNGTLHFSHDSILFAKVCTVQVEHCIFTQFIQIF